ncbi:MAG: insulinase family protein [Colwellia sp.]|nr:insulinase family protein [Colwellia sp.]
MHKYHLLSAILAGVIILTGCGDSVKNQPSDVVKKSTKGESTKSTTSSVDIDYNKFTLENGLEVIFHIDRSDPVVAVTLTAHVGSARELPGKTGFAHLFEHLLFLESENLGKGGLDKMSARIGGSGANGSTSRDRTNYFQTVPNNALEKMIWAEADKLGFFINTVTEPVLAKEKQVVKNEKRQRSDNRPYGHTMKIVDENLYPAGHPYSWQVIGSLEDLQNATLQDVKDFFKHWYVPNNVTLVISGDFDEAQAKQWVHKYFDEIKRGKDIQELAKQPAKLTVTKKLVFEDNFAKSPELTIIWPTVPKYHADSYALEVLKELLSNGKKAELNKVLIDQLKLTSNVTMFNYESELAGQLMLQVRAFENTDLNKVQTAIDNAFSQFEINGFSDDDLARIKAGQETQFYQGLSSALNKGFQLAQYNIFAKDPGFINQDGKNIIAVTKEDVLRVYHQYIKGQHYVATSFVPKGQKSLSLTASVDAFIKEEKIVNGTKENFDASIAANYTRTPSKFDRTEEPAYGKEPVIEAPKVWQSKLKNNIKLYGIESSEVPLVQLEMKIAGGMLFDSPAKVGIANLVAKLMNKGTKNKTPQQLEEAIKQLGASIHISANREGIKITASSLARNYQQTMALVTEMLLQPRWDEVEFDLAKKGTLSNIKQQQVNPNSVAFNQFNKLLYGNEHLLANSIIGSEKSVGQITISDLNNYYTQYFSPSLTDFHIVGDIAKDKVIASLSTLEKQWAIKDVTLPNISLPLTPEKAQIYFYNIPNAKQSVLNIGYPSLKATDKDYYVAQVMNYILGGGSFASQLTQQLRETKGYTYGINSSFTGNQFDGRFTISSGVRANVTLEAISLIKDVVTNYQQDFSEQDLATTQGYYLKSNARKFETFSAKLNILKSMSQYNLPVNYVQQRAQEVSGLTLEKVKSLAGQYIQPEHMIYLVVGDAKTQLERLNKLGLGAPILLNP